VGPVGGEGGAEAAEGGAGGAERGEGLEAVCAGGEWGRHSWFGVVLG
jgi:hypothetical protein